MWFPSENLVIKPAKFTEGTHIIWKDKEGNTHKGLVDRVIFKSLNVGYLFGISIEDSYNGASKMLVKETNLTKDKEYYDALEAAKTAEKEAKKSAKKPRKPRAKKSETEPVAE